MVGCHIPAVSAATSTGNFHIVKHLMKRMTCTLRTQKLDLEASTSYTLLHDTVLLEVSECTRTSRLVPVVADSTGSEMPFLSSDVVEDIRYRTSPYQRILRGSQRS